MGACLLFLTLAPVRVRALEPDRSLTQYIHRIWQAQQGLPQATIFSILQTHDGYIWLGTQGGLVRFDGVHFTDLDEGAQAALKNVWISSLAEDRQQDLWVGTSGAGVVRLRDGALKKYGTLEGLPSLDVRCLLFSRAGELWVGTAKGLARYWNGRFESVSNDNVYALAESPDGKLWIGDGGTVLSVWNGQRLSRYPLESLPASGGVRALLWSRGGALWVGTTDGLVRVEYGKQTRFTSADGLADDAVFSLFESRQGGLWIGTNNGFSRYLNGEFDSFQSRNGLSQSTVYTVAEDRRGDLWVGTKHGLNQFMTGRSISYSASEGFPTNDAGPVLQDSNGNIWAGTLGAGLARFSGRRFAVVTKRQGLASDTIYALAAGPSGDLWVGTDAGLDLLRDGHVVAAYTKQQGLPSNSIRSLFRDGRGVLWVGTAAGPAVLRNGAFVPPMGAREIGPVPVLAFGEDSNGRVLLSVANRGLFIFDGAIRPLAPAGLAPVDVQAIYRDRDGLLWTGTTGNGLWLFKDGRFFKFSMRDGLFDDEIYGIAEGERDELWMACSKGVFSVKRSDLLRFAAGDISQFASAPYSPLDALRTLECRSGVQPAVWRMRDGRIWFSTNRGLVVIDSGWFERKLEPPASVIESVAVNGQAADPKRIGELPPGRNNLEFRYTGLSFVLPTRITFRYMLEGFDKEWVNAGTRRQAVYANLPPGKYVFRLRACNADGTCDQNGASVGFTLKPHFYQRSAFLPLLAALLAAMAWLGYHLRMRRVRERFNLILAERSRIARELHDTLIQGFSGVTMEMQALCSRLSSAAEISVLKDIIKDAADSLHEARMSVAGLRGKESKDTGLAAAIAQTAREITEAVEIRLKLKLDDSVRDLPEDLEYNLFRIAQEALTNSVKHSGARTIQVSLRSASGAIELMVKDDGSGLFEPGAGVIRPGHYGLIGMRERATSIGAEFEITGKPGGGTLVRVRVPLPQRRSSAGMRAAGAIGDR